MRELRLPLGASHWRLWLWGIVKQRPGFILELPVLVICDCGVLLIEFINDQLKNISQIERTHVNAAIAFGAWYISPSIVIEGRPWNLKRFTRTLRMAQK